MRYFSRPSTPRIFTTKNQFFESFNKSVKQLNSKPKPLLTNLPYYKKHQHQRMTLDEPTLYYKNISVTSLVRPYLRIFTSHLMNYSKNRFKNCIQNRNLCRIIYFSIKNIYIKKNFGRSQPTIKTYALLLSYDHPTHICYQKIIR